MDIHIHVWFQLAESFPRCRGPRFGRDQIRQIRAECGSGLVTTRSHKCLVTTRYLNLTGLEAAGCHEALEGPGYPEALEGPGCHEAVEGQGCHEELGGQGGHEALEGPSWNKASSSVWSYRYMLGAERWSSTGQVAPSGG